MEAQDVKCAYSYPCERAWFTNRLDITKLGDCVQRFSGSSTARQRVPDALPFRPSRSSLIEAVRDQTHTVDLKQVNHVLIQPHWRKDYDNPLPSTALVA